jgi:hypothetical protein
MSRIYTRTLCSPAKVQVKSHPLSNRSCSIQQYRIGGHYNWKSTEYADRADGRITLRLFSLVCIPPSLLSLGAGYMVICLIYRNNFMRDRDKVSTETDQEWPAFNIWQSTKGIMAVIVLIILFFTDIPREISAIGVAAILLCSRKMKSRQIMHLVD